MKKNSRIMLFAIIASMFFIACADKPVEKSSAQKPKQITINDLLKESFEYSPNQKLYRIKSPIVKIEESNALFYKFEKLCSEKNGKLKSTDYYINKIYVNAFTKNIATVCELENEIPYFIMHQANEDSNIYHSVTIDEGIRRVYNNLKNKKQPEFEAPVVEDTQKVIQERKEIQKREIAREQKTKILLGQKNQKTMTFFDSWRYSGNEALCAKKCTDINIRTNGYKTLKEAMANNWQLVSQVGDTEEALDDNCTCSGSSVLVKK